MMGGETQNFKADKLNKHTLPPFQIIISHFGFYKYIAFAIHLNIRYV